jgi:hypothetical protein
MVIEPSDAEHQRMQRWVQQPGNSSLRITVDGNDRGDQSVR